MKLALLLFIVLLFLFGAINLVRNALIAKKYSRALDPQAVRWSKRYDPRIKGNPLFLSLWMLLIFSGIGLNIVAEFSYTNRFWLVLVWIFISEIPRTYVGIGPEGILLELKFIKKSSLLRCALIGSGRSAKIKIVWTDPEKNYSVRQTEIPYPFSQAPPLACSHEQEPGRES